MSEGRRNSIGTLTGWQLLAKQQLDRDGDDADSDDDSSSDADDAEAETDNSRQRLHLRSLSNTSNLSEELGGGGSTSCVTPRPHQWLYKEYKILDEIGSGGFGRVCRARRLADGRMVVVKEINTTSLSAKQKAATMDEVLVLNKLNHPNIVKYHDCYMDAVYINIVMEYCNAGDLAGLIKGREGRLMPEDELMSLFVQICLAMHYVHSAGVLHRDLKSSNVLITRADNFGGMPLLKLGDFGVAKMNSAESSMASTIVGTPQYLSPEMCDNKPYGKKSDVWALGCILYELCSLKKAFDGGTGGISGIIIKIMRGAYDPVPAGYSQELKGLVGAMLQVKPKRRPGVADVLSMPYVRRHLGLYLDWARNVPQAHPQILQTSLGDLWPRKAPQDASQQQQQQPPPMLQTIGSGGSCSSLDTQHAPLSPSQQQQQQQQHPQLEQQGSSPLGSLAPSVRAATPTSQSRRVSGTGSNSSFVGPASGSVLSSTDMLFRQGSNVSARSGSATPRAAAAAVGAAGAAAAAAAAAASQLAPAGSNAAEAQQQAQQVQQQQQQWQGGASTPPGQTAAAAGGGSFPPSSLPRSPACSNTPLSVSSSPLSDSHMPAASGPSGGPPPGSLSGWLAGDNSLQARQAIQQRVLSQVQQQRQQQQQHDQGVPLPLQEQQQQQQQQKQQQQQQQVVALDHQDRQQGDQQQQQPSSFSPDLSPQQLLAAGQHQHPQGPSPAAAAAAAGESPAPLSTASGHSGGDLSSGWAYPSVSSDMRRPPTTRTTLAQEQLEGLKAIWDLKRQLQIKPDATGSPGAGPLLRDFLQQQGGGAQQQQQQLGQQGQGQVQQQQQGSGTFWEAMSESSVAMNI